MIELFSIAWDKKAKAWCEIYTSHPIEENFFNSNAKHFDVRDLIDRSASLRKVSATNLTVLKAGDYVEIERDGWDEGEGKTYFAKIYSIAYDYLTVHSTVTYSIKYWREVKNPAPKGFKLTEFKVGDFVAYTFDSQVYGIVTEVLNADTGMYRMEYFFKNDYENVLANGLEKNNRSGRFMGYSFKKLDLPAPRIVKSASERESIRRGYKRNVNSRNYGGNDRFSWVNPAYLKDRIAAYKHNGDMLAKAIAEAKNNECQTLNDYADEIKDILNNVTNNVRDTLWDLISDVAEFHDILTKCPECGAIEMYDDTHYSDWHNTSFCTSCEDDWVYSDLMESYIHTDDAVKYYESVSDFHAGSQDDWVILAWANRQDDVYTYNGEAMDQDTFYELTSEDDYDEDEDDSDNDGLSGYHNSHRNWKEVWANKSYLPLGLEIEVYSEERRDAVSAVRSAFPTMYLEQDGSLHDRYGFEVITQPWGKDEWATNGKKLLNVLKENECKAYNSPAGRGYGIHININRNYLTPMQEMRLFMFLASDENKGFVSAIAQRSSIYNADINIGQFSKTDQTVRYAGGFRNVYTGEDPKTGASIYTKKIQGRGKYAPIKLHDERLEIRIFQSTLNGTSFNKNLEFTWALLEWTGVKASTGSSWMHTDFVKWLAKRPHLEHDYPNLAAFLRKESYKLIEGDTIRNTWKDLIPKETRRSVPQTAVNQYAEESTVEEEPVELVGLSPALDLSKAIPIAPALEVHDDVADALVYASPSGLNYTLQYLVAA